MVEWSDLSELRSKDGESGGGRGRINCFKCVHFRVSWDVKFPRTCTLFGFSGQEMPSETVRKSTGRDCPSFQMKGHLTPEGE
jgi:hypothetical protein